ncbi:hypothetical protein JCM10213_003518 [Rhodosporidiobolus nylandii]
MSKFGSAKDAFAQARALAESGRNQLNKQVFDKVDARYPMGGQKNASTSASVDESGAAPPLPPTRGSAPPPPPGRGRSSSTLSGTGVGAPARTATGGAGTGSVFVGMSSAEKEAFFSLLDEYFAARPHLAGLFQQPASSSSAVSAVPTPVSPAPVYTAPPAAPAATRPPPPAAPQARGIGHAVALYDYDATQPEDLPFKEGERVEILEVVSDDWYRGALNGKEGIFPSSYVQMQG